MELSRRLARNAHVNHERWLVSYADFVTLLFAFFVVLYASAQVDRQRALQLSDAIKSGFQQLGLFEQERPGVPATGPRRPATQVTKSADAGKDSGVASASDFANLRRELEQALAPQIERKEVALHLERDGLVVTLREVGFFDSGSADMKPGAKKAFARLAEILRTHSCTLRIEGHTDNVPIHTAQFASNWELSTARASGLVRSLANTYGISPALLSAAGYAEFRPASANDTTLGRAQNRRVDLVILNADTATNPPAPSVLSWAHNDHDLNRPQGSDGSRTPPTRPFPGPPPLQPRP